MEGERRGGGRGGRRKEGRRERWEEDYMSQYLVVITGEQFDTEAPNIQLQSSYQSAAGTSSLLLDAKLKHPVCG